MPDTTPLLIAGATSPDVLKLIEAINLAGSLRFEVAAFLELDERLIGTEIHGIPVLDERKTKCSDFAGVKVVNNVGASTRARRQAAEALAKRGFSEFVSLVHPGVDLWEVTVGHGCLILQGSVLGPFVQLGDQCVVLAGSNVNHEAKMGGYVFVGPGATLLGRVVLEDGVYVGGGATLLTSVRVGAGSIIGAGSVVTRDVGPGVVVAGNPARVLRAVNETERFSADLGNQYAGASADPDPSV